MYKVSLLMLQIVSGLMSLTRPAQEFRRLFPLAFRTGRRLDEARGSSTGSLANVFLPGVEGWVDSIMSPCVRFGERYVRKVIAR